MKIKINNHPYQAAFIRKAALWCARQIGMDRKLLDPLIIDVSYCKPHDVYRGMAWYHGCLIELRLPRPDKKWKYPVSTAHTAKERADGRVANDDVELFVTLMAHELEHIRAYQAGRTTADRRRLNQEVRVRLVDWRALQAFRADREAILASWGPATAQEAPRAAKAATGAKAPPSAAERREERARAHLAAWERRLKLAKTKVAKYRAKVRYYDRRKKSLPAV